MASAHIEFGVLGPLEVRAADHSLVPLPGGRPSALLALLLVHRGARVGTDAAIDALWPDAAPVHPDNALQLAVSRLRRALGGPESDRVIEGVPGGYALRVPHGALDADRFAALAAAGRAHLARQEDADAATALRHALALWRGPALGRHAEEPWAIGYAARLDEQRIEVTFDRVAADLALGRHAELVDELAALVAAHPLRERARGQLMLALHGAGRRPEALAVFRDGCRLLAEELGVGPSEELTRIEHVVRRAEPPVPGGVATARAPARRRTVTCLAIALIGAGEEPEWRYAAIADAAARLREVCEPLGGTVVDGTDAYPVAVFGWPLTREDDAAYAALAAARLRDVRPAGTAGLAVGLHRGDIAEPAAGRTPAVRDVAAAARALAARAGLGGVLLSEAVESAIRAGVLGTRDGGALRLDRFAPMFTPATAGPIVGRSAEVETVTGWCSESVRGRVALVLGEPGIGKTRLAYELADRLRPVATVLLTHCGTLPGAPPYEPVGRLFGQAADGHHVPSWLAGAGLPARAVGDVAAALGLGTGTPSTAPGRALRDAFGVIAARGPVVVLLDDAHAAADTLLALVASLRDAPFPLLAVCLGRPELATRFDAAARRLRPDDADAPAARLVLGPLADADARALVDRLDPAPPPAAAARIVGAAGGNPLFVEQLVRYAAAHPDDDAPPPALRALLAVRLRELPRVERTLLSMCAVQGETFWPAACPAMSASALPALPAARHAALDRLTRRDLVAPIADADGNGPAYRFRHPLIRDAAYAATSRPWRAALHEAFAGWLAPTVARAWHLEQAYGQLAASDDPDGRADGVAGEAADRLLDAAAGTHARGELAEEINLLRRARALAPDRPAVVASAAALAAALAEAGDFEEAGAVARDGIAAAGRHGLVGAGWRATVERDRVDLYRDQAGVDVAARSADVRAAIAWFTAHDDRPGLARAEYLQAELAWMRGRPDDARACCARQVAHARRIGAGFEIAAGLTYQAWSLVEGTIPVDAAYARLAELVDEAGGDQVALLGLTGLRAVLDSMAGRADDARDGIARARAGFADLGMRLPTAAMSVLSARVHRWLGDHDAAREATATALRVARDTADRWFRATALVDAAHTAVAGGDPVAAGAAVAEMESVPAPHDTEWRVRRAIARSALATVRGDHAAAVAEAEAAVRGGRGTQMLPLRAHAELTRARALAAAGRRDEASSAARAAARLAAQKSDKNTATAARALIPIGDSGPEPLRSPP